MSEYLTPPQLASRWQCTPETVLSLIRSGALRAFTLSAPNCRRPRWRISPVAIAEFEAARQPQVQRPARGRRSSRRDPGYVEYV